MTVADLPHRHIGQTPLRVPVFGYGTAHLGELYALVPEAQSQATLDGAWEAGVRFYDTAPWYGRGLAEHRLGAFLRTKPRDGFQVITKVGRTLHRPTDPTTFDRSPWVGGLRFQVHFDYSYDGVMRSLEASLERLGIDSVDILFAHDVDVFTHGSEAARDTHAIFVKDVSSLTLWTLN